MIPVGTRCEIVGSVTNPSHNGAHVTVICYEWALSAEYRQPIYRIEGVTGWFFSYAAEECLRPIYDGNQKTTWEDCVWQPKKVAV